MRKTILAAMAAAVLVSAGCATLFKDKISVLDAVAKKEEMDRADNIAKKALIIKELGDKRVVVADAVVKDIIPSGNIDYEFSVLVSIEAGGAQVECYIHTQDVASVAGLIKGKTRIKAVGDFGRFFTMLDNKNIKMEIINADIEVLGDK
ncbi:MAG: hypothetical protein EPN93_12985 [Spirochaetes bacterium]|nr:MAG: hypothetical protein EPN93_12985 [Spirochaetota bacterium]